MMPKAAFLVCLYPMQTVFEDLNFQRHHLIFNVITSHHRKHFRDLGSQHRNLCCLQSITKSSLHHLQNFRCNICKGIFFQCNQLLTVQELKLSM